VIESYSRQYTQEHPVSSSLCGFTCFLGPVISRARFGPSPKWFALSTSWSLDLSRVSSAFLGDSDVSSFLRAQADRRFFSHVLTVEVRVHDESTSHHGLFCLSRAMPLPRVMRPLQVAQTPYHAGETCCTDPPPGPPPLLPPHSDCISMFFYAITTFRASLLTRPLSTYTTA